MKSTKFTEQQIVFALKQAETGTGVDEVCRKWVFRKPLSRFVRFPKNIQKNPPKPLPVLICCFWVGCPC